MRTQALKSDGKAKAYAQSVDYGEAEAIALAEELHADHILIDERKGRRLARQQGLPVIGLPGVILLSKRAQLIPSARALLDQLGKQAGIYLSDEVKNAALKTLGE